MAMAITPARDLKKNGVGYFDFEIPGPNPIGHTHQGAPVALPLC